MLPIPLLMYPHLFLFMRDAWIQTQRAFVASRGTTNLDTSLPWDQRAVSVFFSPSQNRLNIDGVKSEVMCTLLIRKLFFYSRVH